MFPRATILRLILGLTLGLSAAMALSGCGKSNEGAHNVAMKDLDVVDGTATDAMTDLDGVRTEGTATVPMGNVAAPATQKAAANASAAAANTADANAEAVPDQ